MDRCALDNLLVPGTDQDVIDAYLTLEERARDMAFGFEQEICVLDVETTGYDPSRDRLVEVAAAIMRGPEIVDRYSTLVDPLVPVPVEITKLTGITDDMVAGAPSAEAAVSALVDFIGDRDIVAHNAGFDRAFIERTIGAGRLRGNWLDSLVFVRIGLPRLRSHRLSDLAAAFVPDCTERAHRAAEDVEALCRIWRIALVGISDLEPGVLTRIAALAPDAPWPERAMLSQILAGRSANAPYDMREVRRRRVAADRAEALNDADDVRCVCPPAEAVAAEFTESGLAGRMYEGYERRDEQVAMAAAVVEAFASGTHAAIEAGTGVGKSMAYLVPAATFALENRVGIGVATKTNALMDQLVYHELPRLSAAFDGELRYVALKGYEHYPCLRKVEKTAAALDAVPSGDTISAIAMLLAWASQSAWGDLDAVNFHWHRELKTQVQSTHADCTHKRCRYYPNLCYLHGARRRAASSHVVVTNHALLFRDVVAQGGILPPIRHWIVDEAHAAESEARKQLTAGSSHIELKVILTALGPGRTGVLDTVRRHLKPDEAADVAGIVLRMQEETQRCLTLSDSLFDFVKDLAPLGGESDYEGAELWVDERIRATGPWGVVASTGASLARRLASLLAEGRELVTRLEALGPELSDARSDVAGLLMRLADQHMGLVAVIDGEDDALVYSAQLDRRRNVDAERLVAARLDVGEVLAEDLYPRVSSVIYTSATIAAGESFEHFARTVGLDRLSADAWTSLRLDSSYDFERQMTVFVPMDIAAPNQGRYLQDLERLLEEVHLAMGGSVLTLFTNRRDMERLHAALEPRLRLQGLDLIMQRRGTSAKRLRDEFIADESLSLFALKSFWEGFDAKGDTLRCVVVPKLPFGRPSDPLAQERERREGAAAWRRYALPEAVIELKQAAGRLIRSSTDHGCLVVADSRVVHKTYGRSFIEALPVRDVERLPAHAVAEQIVERFGPRARQ